LISAGVSVRRASVHAVGLDIVDHAEWEFGAVLKCRASYAKVFVFVVSSGVLRSLLVLTGEAKRGCENAE
jgi:hypothetical protein